MSHTWDLYSKPPKPITNIFYPIICKAGSDSLKVFGGSWHGGYMLQQCPSEFAELLNCLYPMKFESALFIGIAAGGTTRLMTEVLNIKSTAIIDDSKHSAFINWAENKKNIRNLKEFIGDSHSKEAKEFLTGTYDLIMIDAGHYYEDVKQDFEMCLPHMQKGTIIVLHDIVASPQVKQYWDELKVIYEIACQYDDPKECGIGAIRYDEKKERR